MERLIAGYIKENNYEAIVDELNQKLIYNDKELYIKDIQSIDINDEKIYISRIPGIIEVYSKENQEKLAEFGKNILDEPFGIKVYNKKIYVTDRATGTLVKFDENGEFEKKSNKLMKFPLNLDICGEKIFVIDLNNSRVAVFDLELNLLYFINDLHYPRDLKIYKDKLYIADQFNNRILRTDLKGEKFELVKTGEAYSVIEIYKDELYIYDEKNDIFLKEELKEKYSNVEKEKVLIKKEENYFQNKIEEIDFEFEKARDVFVKGENMYVSLQTKRQIIKYNRENMKIDIYQFEKAFDRIVVLMENIYCIDYYSREIVVMDKNFSEKYILAEKELKNPNDIQLVDSKLAVLDSELMKIILYKSTGRKRYEIDLIGEYPCSFVYKDGLYYVLDKRKNRVDIYEREYIKSIELENINYPEDIAIDNSGKMYISSELEKKINIYEVSGDKLGEEKSFLMPGRMRCFESQLYVCDYAKGRIKIFKVSD